MGFCFSPKKSYLDLTNPALLSGLFHLDNLIVILQFLQIYRDWQKPYNKLTPSMIDIKYFDSNNQNYE